VYKIEERHRWSSTSVGKQPHLQRLNHQDQRLCDVFGDYLARETIVNDIRNAQRPNFSSGLEKNSAVIINFAFVRLVSAFCNKFIYKTAAFQSTPFPDSSVGGTPLLRADLVHQFEYDLRLDDPCMLSGSIPLFPNCNLDFALLQPKRNNNSAKCKSRKQRVHGSELVTKCSSVAFIVKKVNWKSKTYDEPHNNYPGKSSNQLPSRTRCPLSFHNPMFGLRDMGLLELPVRYGSRLPWQFMFCQRVNPRK